jgi:DNA-binding protein YbaB
LRGSIAFHDVTVGMASDWFRELQSGVERGFRPAASDLDNPAEVTQTAILTNYLKDITSWDDEARRLIGPMLDATSLHSQDKIKRLPPTNSAASRPNSTDYSNPWASPKSLNSAAMGHKDSSAERQAALDELTNKKVQGLSVRFSFEVDVHHDGDGKVTAIDIVRDAFEKQLQEKIRLAIEDAVHQAQQAPTLVNGGRPFRSRWLFSAIWFMTPPACLLTPSDALDAEPGVLQGGCGGSFDVGKDGFKGPSFAVQQRARAELIRVTPLSRSTD